MLWRNPTLRYIDVACGTLVLGYIVYVMAKDEIEWRKRRKEALSPTT